MGANAQTSVPTFTAGDVLTAANMNISARTGVPVFATTVTRDAAFGGAGEKTLAEGQMCYVEGTGFQTYNGTAWVTWGTTAGLVLVKAETSFSAASSVTADNVFSSSYTNYIITLRYTTSTTNSPTLKLRVGGTSASTNYNSQFINGSSTSISGARSSSATSLEFGVYTNGNFFSSATINVYGAALAEATTFETLNAYNTGAYTTPNAVFYTGNHSTATAYDGIEFLVATGSMTGSYTIYGMAK